MGIDNRNQHDLILSMPGGVAGINQMIADFHRRGVRVLFPMMMWDQGTRLPDHSWPEEIASLMAEIGSDGINGDTQDGVPPASRWPQKRPATRSSSTRKECRCDRLFQIPGSTRARSPARECRLGAVAPLHLPGLQIAMEKNRCAGRRLPIPCRWPWHTGSVGLHKLVSFDDIRA